MKRDLIYQHFQKSGFDDMQADALAAILDEMATKQDLALLRSELSSLRSEMNAGHAALRNEACLFRRENRLSRLPAFLQTEIRPATSCSALSRQHGPTTPKTQELVRTAVKKSPFLNDPESVFRILTGRWFEPRYIHLLDRFALRQVGQASA